MASATPDTNLTLDHQKAELLRAMLHDIQLKLAGHEAGIIRALQQGAADHGELMELFSMLLSHDHCELCGATVWGTEHSC